MQSVSAQIEPTAGKWRTWVPPSVAQIRSPAPPNAADSAAEIQTLKMLMLESTARPGEIIAMYGTGFGPTNPDDSGLTMTAPARAVSPPAAMIGGPDCNRQFRRYDRAQCVPD
jgi:uncharacterized protein (TIGR03437 family)